MIRCDARLVEGVLLTSVLSAVSELPRVRWVALPTAVVPADDLDDRMQELFQRGVVGAGGNKATRCRWWECRSSDTWAA